ncbi:hypothetical protein ACQKOM_24210 [Peribacillus frigoritolerans]|uniref:hypothetical protein n=1 Tax=Peribacillus frigoritolerans TaxID=450367 RepID=UPI003D01BE82
MFYESVIGWKKSAKLLPRSWLTKTPQALEPRRLGRQSAEKERIFEIDWKYFLNKKTAGTRFICFFIVL